MKSKPFTPLDFCEDAINKKHFLEMQWLELCAMLKEIRDKDLFAGRWDTFEDFLTDPAMGMDKGTASKMINIHEKLTLEYKVKPTMIANAGGWSKVAELLPTVKNKEDAEAWLAKAAVLSKSDLRKEIKEEKTGIQMSKCRHRNSYKVVMCCCRDCGGKEIEKYL